VVYTLRFSSSKRSLFYNSNVFGSCIIHILYIGCAKIKKKKHSGIKRLMSVTLHNKPAFSPQCKVVAVQLVWTLWFRFPLGSLDFPLTMAVRSTKPLTEMGLKAAGA